MINGSRPIITMLIALICMVSFAEKAHARRYLASIGRFDSRDPLGHPGVPDPVRGSTPRIGLYTYAMVSPGPMGSFVHSESPRSIEFRGGSPDGNLYAYVENRPTTHVDPYGEFGTYGQWGGPGYSGGAWPTHPTKTDWSKRPDDAMDACFKEHDWQYQEARLRHEKEVADCKKTYTDPDDLDCCVKGADYHQEAGRNDADCELYECMKRLPNDPRKWGGKGPTYKAHQRWYARRFRTAGQAIFKRRCKSAPNPPKCCIKEKPYSQPEG